VLTLLGMAVIVAGRPEEIPGLHTVSWFDHPELRLRKGEDYRSRNPGTWIRQIILHTTKGLPAKAGDPPQEIRVGIGAPVNAGQRVAEYWSRDGRQAGAHLVVDHDGTVACCCDLQADAAYHASVVNSRSVGVEIFQGSHAELYLGQLQVVVSLCDWLTRRFGIQRQIPERYDGGPLRRLELGGEDCVGVFGHRDVTANRGPGDPGSMIFELLRQAGYEQFDFAKGADLDAWRPRQSGLLADGIPGPDTVAALRATGRTSGIWVVRPGDEPGPAPTT
jgi:N-acetylmuramoyl-L-alanine amidase-like protein